MSPSILLSTAPSQQSEHDRSPMEKMNDPYGNFSQCVRRVWNEVFKPWKAQRRKEDVEDRIPTLPNPSDPRGKDLLKARHLAIARNEWFKMLRERGFNASWWVMTNEEKKDMWKTLHWQRKTMAEEAGKWDGSEVKKTKKELDFYLQQETRTAAGKMMRNGVKEYDKVTGGPQFWNTASKKLSDEASHPSDTEMKFQPLASYTTPLSTASGAAAAIQQRKKKPLQPRHWQEAKPWKSYTHPPVTTVYPVRLPSPPPIQQKLLQPTNLQPNPILKLARPRPAAVDNSSPKQDIVPPRIPMPFIYEAPAPDEFDLSELESPNALWIIEKKIGEFYRLAGDLVKEYVRSLPSIARDPAAMDARASMLETALHALSVRKKFEWKVEIEWDKKMREGKTGLEQGQQVVRKYDVEDSEGNVLDKPAIAQFSSTGVVWLNR